MWAGAHLISWGMLGNLLVGSIIFNLSVNNSVEMSWQSRAIGVRESQQLI